MVKIMSSTQKYWESEEAKVHGDTSSEVFERFTHIVLERLQPNSNETILDVGCGDGELTRRIAERSKATLVGMDFSKRSITRASKSYPYIQWVQGDALEKWKFEDNYFDKLFSFGFLQYIPPSKLRFVLEETKRVLKAGGRAYHLDVPDKTKFFKWFNSPKKFLQFGIYSWITGKIFPADGSYWHKPQSVLKIAHALDLDCVVCASASSYRCDIILTKKKKSERK